MNPILTMPALPIEIRSEEEEGEVSDGRTIEGRMVPFGEVIEVEGTREAFMPGVFAGTDPSEVVVLWQHDRSQPIGRMTEIREEEDGYYGTLRLASTPRALEAAALSAERVIRGLSVGFIPDRTTRRSGIREHTRARLIEISLVTFPAIPGAAITATREEAVMDTPATEQIEGELLEVQGLDLAPLESRMEELAIEQREMRNHLANIVGVPAPVEAPMSLHAAFAQLLIMVAEHPAENRALADVIGTAPGNASGLIRDQMVSELLGILNSNRPLFSAAGSVGFPSSGYGLAFPQITQHTLVAKRGAEKTAIPSRELIVGGVTYPMEWFAGGVDVALELISQSDPSVVEVVVSDLLDQYAQATELEFSVDAVAAATVGGAVLDYTDWSTWVAGVVTTSREIRTATGQPGNLLALTDASWLALVQLLNPDQPSISFGAGPDFTAESVSVGGITAFNAPYLTADLQFNAKALRKSERPPETVTATNVALMGRDIGILGATIAIPAYPAGIIKHTATV